MPIETPGNPITHKSHKTLMLFDPNPEDKYPWSAHQILHKKKSIKESALMEVSPEYVINILMNSKKKPNLNAVNRAAKIINKMSLNAAKKKGIKAGITKNIDAVVHATRHPKVKRVVDIINITEPQYQALPLHPGRW